MALVTVVHNFYSAYAGHRCPSAALFGFEAAMARKSKMAPLAEDQIPTFVALVRQVAADQLTPEQAERRRRMMAAAQIPLEVPPIKPAAE